MANIHPTAIVDKNAQIGANVEIGPFCIIGPDVKIGDNCRLASSVVVQGHTTLGQNNIISPGVVIGTAPQDLKWKGEPTQVIIGCNNTIREYATINLSTSLTEPTRIGDENLLMAYCHVAHNCQLGNGNIIANSVQMAGHVHIDNFVTIGGSSAINQFVRVGSYAFVGGMSGLRKDVPPFTRGAGEPYFAVGLNSIGLQRKGFTDQQIEGLNKVYRWIYKNDLTITQAVEHIADFGPLSEQQQLFVDFIKVSERGICRAR